MKQEPLFLLQCWCRAPDTKEAPVLCCRSTGSAFGQGRQEDSQLLQLPWISFFDSQVPRHTLSLTAKELNTRENRQGSSFSSVSLVFCLPPALMTFRGFRNSIKCKTAAFHRILYQLMTSNCTRSNPYTRSFIPYHSAADKLPARLWGWEVGRQLGHVSVIIHQASLGFFTWQWKVPRAARQSNCQVLLASHWPKQILRPSPETV